MPQSYLADINDLKALRSRVLTDMKEFTRLSKGCVYNNGEHTKYPPSDACISDGIDKKDKNTVCNCLTCPL